MGPERGLDAAWDLFELYQARTETGTHARAAVRFWLDVASIAGRPNLWRVRNRHQTTFFHPIMIVSNLKLALRRIRTTPVFTGLNALGLGVGFVCVLLIFLYVSEETSFDRHHPDSERLYRVTIEWLESGTHWAPIGPPVGPALAERYPDIEAMSRFFPAESPSTFQNGDVRFVEPDGGFADSNFFDVFGHELVHGDPRTALTSPWSLVISEEIANRFFGRTDVVGESLEVPGTGMPTISGVFRQGGNTHLDVDWLYSMSSFYQMSGDWADDARTWAGFMTYVRLRQGADAADFEARLPGFVDDFYAEDADGPASEEGRLILQPVESIHLHSDLEKEYRAGGDIAYVWTFSLVAVFVLLIAVINFVNLSTARATVRMREVAVRKTFGASRSHVARQLLVESSLQSIFALALGAALFVLAIPVYNELTGQAVTWSVLFERDVALALICVTAFVALAAGAYPALMISGFRPISGLRGDRDGSTGKVFLRKGLVVFQFAASIFLMITAVAIWQQLRYMQDRDLGFDRDGVLALNISDQVSEMIRNNPMTIRQALVDHPQIVAVSQASDLPGERYSMEGFFLDTMSSDDAEAMRVAWVSDHDYVDALGLELVAGRTFSRHAPQDTSAWVINEAAAGRLGLAAADAVGRTLNWGSRYTGPIVGVVRDFNIASLHRTVEPLVVPLRPGWGNYLIVRYSGDPTNGLIENIRETMNRHAPGETLDYTFLDDKMAALYGQEQRMKSIIFWFSGLAILVACLGLFGLAAYAVTRRTTEIGVRKVLGAGTAQIMALVSREFVLLVGVAFVFAAPIAWWALTGWLESFAYRIDLSVWPFLAAGAVAVALAVLTVGGHAMRAASLNPVTAIKRE